MATASISVIIPCYNARAWIAEAIQSVYAQELDNVEIIVVDDGSTDGSGSIVAERFPDVRLIRVENGGVSRARNIGIAAASGDFIQFLDADDLLGRDKLKVQGEALERTGADVTYCDWQNMTRQPDGQFELGPVEGREIQSEPDIALFVADGWRPPHAYLYRRSIVERVGGFREHLRTAEDPGFPFDCAVQGARFAYTPGPTVKWRNHSLTQLSRRDPIAITRDCLTYITEVQELWRAHGRLTTDRINALVSAYYSVARSSYRQDPLTFEIAHHALQKLRPGFIPRAPRALALLSTCVGYRMAEELAYHYRRLKRALTRTNSPLAQG